MQLDLEGHTTLIQSILQGKLAGWEHGSAQLIETHISSVIVTGQYVYKFKKPVNLGFLDFSTLQKRQFYCAEEIRLNKRLSPQLYIDVMAVYGTVENPSFIASGPVLDYLVRMKPFPQQAQLDRLLRQGALTREQLSRFATYIARFHQSAAVATEQDSYGDADSVMRPVRQNFVQIRALTDNADILQRLQALEQWSLQSLQQYRDTFQSRKSHGFVRECHGDLHLRNLAWMNDQPLAFDCIEFDPCLYWIDVMSDIAFLLMDLRHQQRHDLAQVFLNDYLEYRGDYGGLILLRFYLMYRAMVRAKVEMIIASQTGISGAGKQQALAEFESYLSLGEDMTRQGTPAIFIMHGLSGSGKSTVAKQLSGLLDAIVIRSDVERKRLYGLDSAQNSSNDFEQGIYTHDATQRTYQRLLELTEKVIQAGYPVIVDATFARPEQRDLFFKLAQDNLCRYYIVDLNLPVPLLKKRLVKRTGDVSDADISVLEKQLEQWQPLREQENKYVIALDAAETIQNDRLLELISRAG